MGVVRAFLAFLCCCLAALAVGCGGDDGGSADAPEDPGDEPEGKGPEDTQPPGEQTSPGEDQYAPDAGGESDPETTTG